VDRSEQVSFNDFLCQKSDEELKFYLWEGVWPDSDEKSVSPTGLNSQR